MYIYVQCVYIYTVDTHTECNNNCNFVFFITDMLITYLMFNDKNPVYKFFYEIYLRKKNV